MYSFQESCENFCIENDLMSNNVDSAFSVQSRDQCKFRVTVLPPEQTEQKDSNHHRGKRFDVRMYGVAL